MRLCMTVFLFVSALVVLSSAARTHEWYPYECCAGGDCYAISPNEIEGLPDGSWKIKATGEIFAGPNANSLRKVRFSPDGGFHRCSRNRDRKAASLCLFIPLPNGS